VPMSDPESTSWAKVQQQRISVLNVVDLQVNRDRPFNRRCRHGNLRYKLGEVDAARVVASSLHAESARSGAGTP
jgi:hypothetical protein